MQIMWVSESITVSWGPGKELIVPPATMLVRDVDLL